MSFLNFLVGNRSMEPNRLVCGAYKTVPFFNCREKGFVLLWNPIVGSSLKAHAWAFVEGRNHDGLVCWSWEVKETLDRLKEFWTVEDVPNGDEVYENRKGWDNGNFGEACEWLFDEMGALEDKQAEMNRG